MWLGLAGENQRKDVSVGARQDMERGGGGRGGGEGGGVKEVDQAGQVGETGR